MELQMKLKRLTETLDWISDTITRSVVQQLRAELYPHAFRNMEEQKSLGLLETIDPPTNEK